LQTQSGDVLQDESTFEMDLKKFHFFSNTGKVLATIAESVSKRDNAFMTRNERIDLTFPWPVMRSIVAGESAIDVPKLSLNSLAEAEAFLECYGYIWADEGHRQELESFRNEAWEFIDEELLIDLNIQIPDELRAEADLRKLLIYASESIEKPRQGWACALLRVMHTFAHCRSHFNELYGDAIREQILTRFEPHLTMTLQGLVLGPAPGIELSEFEVKPSKPARSVVMKLLQKPENVAADIFDRVGVRFVTRERFDALLVVRYLRANNVVMFANIKPSRSRNTLLNLDAIMADLEEVKALASENGWSNEREVEWLRERAASREYPAPPAPSANPFSAVAYHSIQFTCRQLIRVQSDSGKEIRFFFPYEVQVLDERSYDDSRSGFASHELYKDRQKEAVIRRVLRRLTPT